MSRQSVAITLRSALLSVSEHIAPQRSAVHTKQRGGITERVASVVSLPCRLLPLQIYKTVFPFCLFDVAQGAFRLDSLNYQVGTHLPEKPDNRLAIGYSKPPNILGVVNMASVAKGELVGNITGNQKRADFVHYAMAVISLAYINLRYFGLWVLAGIDTAFAIKETRQVFKGDRIESSHELNLLKRWFSLWLGPLGSVISRSGRLYSTMNIWAPKFPDRPHVQLKGIPDLVTCRALFAKGGLQEVWKAANE